MTDEYRDIDNNELDAFDLDLFDDDDDDFSSGDMIPKEKVTKLFQKRLSKEKSKIAEKEAQMKKAIEEFKEVYGVSPEEAIEFGRRERVRYQQENQQPGYQGVVDPNYMPDPVVRKIAEIDQWRVNLEQRQQREREALEFLQKYPNVKFEDIPREVLERRSRGGVTLSEAYELVMGKSRATEAAKKAAESTARDFRNRDYIRAEGPDISGGTGDDVGSLTDDERKFAQMYGMTPKQYVAYKAKYNKIREQGGS